MEQNNVTSKYPLDKVIPLVTVIVPIYNVEEYVTRCIQSIVNQTYYNLQIILVNDGSTDNCGKICDEYACRDFRIQVFHKVNEGQSSARNLGLQYAEGKYINFVDSDDWIDEEFYEKLVIHSEINSLDLCVCSRKSVDVNGIERILPVGDSTNVFQSIDHYFSNHFFQPFTPSTCNKLYLRKYIIEHMIKFEPVIHVGSEDTLFNFTYLLNVSKIGSLDDVFYNQFIRKGSTALTYSAGIMIRTKNLILECDKVLRKAGKDNSSHKAAVAYMFLYFFNYNVSRIKEHFPNDEKKVLKEEFNLIAEDKIIRQISFEILWNKNFTGILKQKGYKPTGMLLTKLLFFLIYTRSRKSTLRLLQQIHNIH